jgi:hypothetical protein
MGIVPRVYALGTMPGDASIGRWNYGLEIRGNSGD